MATNTCLLSDLRGPALAWVCLLMAAGFAGCGDDDANSGDGVPTSGRYAGCNTIIKAGSDTEAIQTALIQAKTKTMLCFEDGVYPIASELSLSVNDVTIRGNSDDREAVLLDYTHQSEGKDALSVSSAGFTIEHLSVKNSHGNAIVVKGTERVTFRDLKVQWDAGSVTSNGAYAVYPLGSSDVLVEDCEVIGASDSGLYVGQSKNIIVRNNTVHGNVTGIEIENSDDALVTGNHVYDNTAGILAFVLPNLEKKAGRNTIIENNQIESNNRDNFGQAGTTVSFVPPGIGILVLANDHTEVRDNDIHDNKTTGVLAISYSTYNTICSASGGMNCDGSDGMTDPDLSKTYEHGDTFDHNGYDPDALVAALLGSDLPNVMWDGYKPADAVNEDQFCLGSDPASFLKFGDQDGIYNRANDVTDGSLFSCTLPPPFDAIELPQDK
jgi:parallel beta-helix repeat protein